MALSVPSFLIVSLLPTFPPILLWHTVTLIPLYPSFSQNLVSGKELTKSFILKCMWFIKLNYNLFKKACINFSQRNEAVIVGV